MWNALTTDFALLLVTINPMAIVPVFLGVTAGMSKADQRKTALRATIIATIILLFFLALGQVLLGQVGVSLPALRVAGALVLLILGLRMVYGEISDSPSGNGGAGDIAVFPLAMPMLAGGGSITAIVSMTDHYTNSIGEQVATALVMLVVMAIIYVVLIFADRIQAWIGATGINVVSRIMGLVLTALAVQTFFSVFKPLLPGEIYP
jgi:multiple antibiotic resistance protein